MELQNLFTEVKKLALLQRYDLSKLGPISRKIAKCMGKYRDPAIWKFASKSFNSSPHGPNCLIFCNKLAFMNAKRTCFLDFWYFTNFGHFWASLGQILAKNQKNCIFWPNRAPKMTKICKISKIQKTSSLCIHKS